MRSLRTAPDRAILGARPRTVAEDMARFMQNVTVTDSGCWEWRLARDRKGYARTSSQGVKKVLAHRASWTVRYGDPGELCVLHRCDNPPCVNPKHLFLGTIADNNADMTAKGRQSIAHLLHLGEDHGMSKLTEADVRRVRVLYGAGIYQREIGRRFGITQSQVHRIVTGKKWRHVA